LCERAKIVFRQAVVAPQHLHHARDAAAPVRRCEEVDMTGHQHIAMDATLMCEQGLLQRAQIPSIVHVADETRLAIIATLNDVPRDAGKFEAVAQR
jgi:hypothetical protein